MKLILFGYIILAVHEILHILGYKICGFKIKFAYIFPIVYKGKASILQLFLTGVLGLVVPEMNNVEGKDIKKKMVIAIIAPVVFHVFMGAVCIVLYIKVKNESILDFMLLNILFFLMTIHDSNGVYGDTIAAFHMIKDDSVSDNIIDGLKSFKCNTFL